MAWAEEPFEEARFGDRSGDEQPEDPSEGSAPGDLLAEVNAVARHLRELQRRLGSYGEPAGEGPAGEGLAGEGPAGEELAGEGLAGEGPPSLEAPLPEEPVGSVPPPSNGLMGHAEETGDRVAAIIAAAEATAEEIRSRAEAAAAETLTSAETAAARIRDEARNDERKLFEAIDALRPATAELQQALERVHDAAVAALMSYPRG